MPRSGGPTIARLQLAADLKRLREGAHVTHLETAEILGCSESKIYKIESGDVAVNRSDLLVILDHYGVIDRGVRDSLLTLQKEGKERGWWAKYGQFSNSHNIYIGLESAASVIRTFELAVIPGLLQIEGYTRAMMETKHLGFSADEVDRRVQMRIARQACLTEDPPLQFWAVIDEGAIRRQIGGPAVLRAQLDHLLDVGALPNVTIQVLPFAEGTYMGAMYSVAILEFPEGVHSPVAYSESSAGEIYMERENDLQRVTLAYAQISSAALSASQSAQFIATVAKELI